MSQDVIKRHGKAFERDINWYTLLETAYEYFLPQRDVFNTYAKGQKKDSQIYDSTAVKSIKQFANKMQEQLTPIHREWAILQLSDEVKALIKDDEQAEKDAAVHLQEVTDIVFQHINRSNFATQINEAYLDLAIGTCALTIEETDDDTELLEFNVIPQNVVAFGKSSRNKLEHIYRSLEIPVSAVETIFPGYTMSQSMRSKLERDPSCDVTIKTAIEYEEGRFKAYAWDDKEIAWEEDYGDISPYIVARWAVVSGELRGRGPALDVLSDVKTLNKITEFTLKKAAIDIGGVWTGNDDGGFNPYNVRIAPGIIIPVSSNNSENPSLRRLDTGGDLNLTLFEVERLQTSIKEHLFNDLRDPAGPVRSATEIALDARELAMRIGSAFGRIQSELLIPILNRVIAVLARRGLLPKYKIGGRDISVKFTSPLARLQDQEDLLALQESLEFVGALSPELMQLGFKLEDLPKFLQEKKGFDAELVRTQSEVQELSQQAMQAQQQEGMTNEAG